MIEDERLMAHRRLIDNNSNYRLTAVKARNPFPLIFFRRNKRDWNRHSSQCEPDCNEVVMAETVVVYF
jgi:hypothetical protein